MNSKTIFGIICGVISVIVGAQTIGTSYIANEFSPIIYHILNAVAGFFFGLSVVTFFANLGKVIEVTAEFAKWFVVATFSLMVTAAYLTIQFYRIY